MWDCYVVVLGMSPTGLYAVRELGTAGIKVYVADTELMAAGFSKYIAASRRIVAKTNQELKKRLEDVAKSEDTPGILMPTSDKYIEFIVENNSELGQLYKFQQSYNKEFYQGIVDKGHFARKCQEHGVAHPGTWTFHGSELASAVQDLRFPCILKPTLIHLVRDYMSGQKVLIVRDQKEFLAHLKHIADIDAYWMVQEIIPGPESQITLFGGFFSGTGELCQPFSCRKLRQYPAGFGSASLVRSELLEETIEISRRFLTEMGFQGIAGTEFKFDTRDNILRIIEINPRPTLWFGCSNASGKRIALAAVNDLLAQGKEPLEEESQKDAVEWQYLGKDSATRVFYRFKGKNFVLPHENLKKLDKPSLRVWAVFCWRDPLPLYGELLNYAQKFFRRAFKRVS